MYRLAHFSDIHLGPLPAVRYRDLASKRITGYINWRRSRRHHMQDGIAEKLIADLRGFPHDHIAVTGDLVNLALDGEIEMARLWLEALGPYDDVSLVPGNHDAYVPGALDRACRAWGGWMTGDGAGHRPGRVSFPYLRRRGPLAIIGVSSARATAPFMASGSFSGVQARRMDELLRQTGAEGLFRVVLIHHPPVRGATAAHKRLFGITRFQRSIRSHGAELVLHGHTHLPTTHWIDGPEGPVPVVGVAAAGQATGTAKPAAQYNYVEIDRAAAGWRVELTRRGIVGATLDMATIGNETFLLRRDTAAA